MNNIKEIEQLIDDCNSKLNCILSLEKNNQDQDKLIIKLLGLGGNLRLKNKKL